MDSREIQSRRLVIQEAIIENSRKCNVEQMEAVENLKKNNKKSKKQSTRKKKTKTTTKKYRY